jgi:ATP-dependent helicase/nuclease subunit B
MIIAKHHIDKIDIDFLINSKLSEGKIDEVLFIVPTKRKIRYLTRDLVSLSPANSLFGLKIETIGSFTEKILTEIDGNIVQISEQVAILHLNHCFKKVNLNYFSQYRDQIPFGTLERIKNVIAEYKRHGITPNRLKEEAKKLSGREKLKAIDIAEVYDEYQKTLARNKIKETGDVYLTLNSKSKKEFDESFNFIYSGCKYVLVNGFDEFTAPEVEIINAASEVNETELFVILDYYKFNPAVFSHLNSCHNHLLSKGFSEAVDLSTAAQSRFLNIVRENLSIRKFDTKESNFKDSVNEVSAVNREEEVELIAKEIKKLILINKVDPEKICVVFNLIGNYSAIIRDRFNVYGIPFNLTDRFSLNTSSPVKAVINFLEILENDFFYKNIFRALSNDFFAGLNIDISNLLKISTELKIVSGYEIWLSKLKLKIAELSASENYSGKSDSKINSYESALSDLEKIKKSLKPFALKITPAEFKENLFTLIFNLNFPSSLLNAPPEVIENDITAFNSFLKLIDEVMDMIQLEYGEKTAFPVHFFLNQIRTSTVFTRYNVSEKPGYGVQITTLNEIRGLSFDYLFIGGLNDGDLPTRFTPEIFFSGSFVREEIRHQVEQRYLFYQALCTWKKKLYLSFPQTDDKRELVKSSFLQDFNSLFESKIISGNNFKDEIYSREELLDFIGKLSDSERLNLRLTDEYAVDLETISRKIEVDKKRIENPFQEFEYAGFISPKISNNVKKRLAEVTEGEFSATQLENYAKCPYKYLVENILKLETVEEPKEELEAFEYGSLIHSILYEFYTKLKEKSIVLYNCNKEQFKSAEELLFKIADRKFDKLNLNPEFSFYEREKLLGLNGRRTQSLLYKFLEEELNNDGGYIPEFFELSFGKVKNEEVKNQKVSEPVNAAEIKLRGKIDRIDINEKSKTFKVIDYKLGGTKPTSEDLSTGISLQLPLYLFAAKELIKRELFDNYEPAGAQIFSLKFNVNDFGKKDVRIKRKSKTENVEEDVSSSEEMINICLEMIKNITKDISNGKFHLSTLENREEKVCRYCHFKRICRIQEVD